MNKSKRKSKPELEPVFNTSLPDYMTRETVLKSSKMRLKERYPTLKMHEAIDSILNETKPKEDDCKPTIAAPTRVRILQQGAELTCGERQKNYGNAVINMQHMAGLLTAYFYNLISAVDNEGMNHYHFTGEDAAQIMMLAKASRTANRGVKYHEDNYTDQATYSAIAGECAENERPSL